MSSPRAFLLSPRRGLRHECQIVESSSPDLPPLRDILAKKPARPQLTSGSRAAPIPENATTTFVSAASLWRSVQAEAGSPPRDRLDTSATTVEITDASLVILDTSAIENQVPKSRAPRKRSAAPKTTSKSKASEESNAAKVTKKRRAKTKAKVTEEEPQETVSEPTNGKKEHGKKTGIMSAHFASKASPDPPALPKTKDLNEPLHLEPAMIRRVDWTPPAQKQVIHLELDSSTSKQLCSSESTGRPASKFKNLIQDYACQQEDQAAAIVLSGDDSSFLKKRKRIELVTTNESNPAPPVVIDKAPLKRKAPKKKPRTITALATAAYKPLTQPEPLPPPSSLLNYFPGNGAEKEDVAEPQQKGKGKAKPRKRAAKASKKKVAPPKPILLSPSTALKQVANQDFVFGTSSQLAREPSPTLLRDLQTAIRYSNQVDSYDFTTPVNSDEIEPSEQRPKLWEAAARDADGDLFDIEVINLADGTSGLPSQHRESDPFGYFKGDDAVDPPEAVNLATDDSFIDLSDILPPPGGDPIPFTHERSPAPSESSLSVSSSVPGQLFPSTQSPQITPVIPRTEAFEDTMGSSSDPQVQPKVPPRPKYEGFTDIQLAKAIKSYGFKPVKRRNAMLALLDQCWESKVRMGQAGIHTSASVAAKPKSTQATTSKVAPKKPRGRPRKNSINASEPQEPPPSAQPPSSPSPSPSLRRSPGRPRKDAARADQASASQTKRARSKSKSPKKTGATAKRKKADVGSILEIPDSASDHESDIASLSSSSPDRVFSPPPLDLSLGDDTELSLAASPTDQQAALFDYITKAITTAPRTTDPSNPSWLEKILLYDPIILEDLTAWLNSGQLTRVGCDEEIYPGLVKQWCESKSVCCLWKVSLRGRERKRF